MRVTVSNEGRDDGCQYLALIPVAGDAWHAISSFMSLENLDQVSVSSPFDMLPSTEDMRIVMGFVGTRI